MPDIGKREGAIFFNNLDGGNVVFNDLLQLKMRNALHDSSRLLINMTVGMGGIIDVAVDFALYRNHEDFG